MSAQRDFPLSLDRSARIRMTVSRISVLAGPRPERSVAVIGAARFAVHSTGISGLLVGSR